MERRRFIQIAGLAALGTVAATPCASAADKQNGWRWCKKCEGLFIEEWVSGDNVQQSVCPAGEKHSLEDTSFYVLTVNDNGGSGQKKWRWCHKCQGLWFSEGDEKGKCPAGDKHSDKDSGDYALEQDGKGQENWRRCRKCQGLWFAGSGNAGKCPAGDGHLKTDSGNYTLEREAAYAQPPVSGKQSPGVELLDAVMLNYLKKIGCSAASLTVARSRHAGPQGMRPTADQVPLYSRGYGWSDSDHKAPMQPDTPMSLASCDKPFTAAAIRQLALDGKLELNASVFKLLKIEPKGEVVDKRVWDVTINHLLEHKAGWQGEPYQRAWQAANGKKDPISAETKLPYVMVQKLAWAPGEKAEYDSFGYATLSLIVERVSGQSWPDYIRDQLCRPYGVRELKWVRHGARREGEPPQLWNGVAVEAAPELRMGVSTAAMCTFMSCFWVNGLPRDDGHTERYWGGSWLNSTSRMIWRSDGINVACVFNGRRVHDGIVGQELIQVIDKLIKDKKLPPPKPAANLLLNGSFEQGSGVGSFLPLAEGSTAIKGWRVTRGQIGYIGEAWKAADGGRSLHLYGSPGEGRIQQSFNTTKGQRYRVSFSMAGHLGGKVAVKRLAVNAAGKTQEFAFDTTGSKGDNVATDPNPTTGLFAFETCCRKGDNMGWVEYVWEFEAVAEKTTLEFYTAMTTDPNFGPALDDVRVVAVPGKK